MKIFFIFVILFLSIQTAFAASDLMNMYRGYQADSQIALTRPHRSINELASWLSDTAANALIFTPGHTAEKLTKLRPLFSEQGYKAYTTFLSQLGFAEALQKQTLSLTTIVNHAPVLVGQGASTGRYAWAYELPVILTVTLPGQTETISREVTLRIQIGRSPQGSGPHYVLIENWQEFREASPIKDDSGKPD